MQNLFGRKLWALLLPCVMPHVMRTQLQISTFRTVDQFISMSLSNDHAGSGPSVITGSSQPTRPEGIQYISHEARET